MNPTQIQTTVAPLVAFFAGLLAGKGVFGLDATTWTTVIGAIVASGAAIWGAIATRGTNLITAAADLDEVHSIKLEPTAPQALVTATPANVTK
jgi:hypothetical protein